MKADSSRWTEITPTQYPWEREAIDYVREKLPDHDPYRGFALFEFIASNGSINEVDLLAVVPSGIYLIEIKSWPGVVGGDQRDWVREQEGRRPRYDENPLLGADRKAKRLASLLAQQPSVRKAKARIPFIQPLVFLSHPDVVCKLPPFARQHVYLRDESPEGRDREGIISALTQSEPRRVDRPMLQLVLRALNEAGVRPSRRKRQVGDFVVGELLAEGPGYQDFKAAHTSLDDLARVRIYGLDKERPADEHEAIRRAARREYELIGALAHPGFDSPRLYTETETGPALVYHLDESAERLDTYLATRADQLSFEDRVGLVRQLAETLDYAHRKNIVHRSLSPFSIDVASPDSIIPTLRLRDWHAGFHLDATGGHTRGVTSHASLLVPDPAQIYLAPEALRLGDEADSSVDSFSFGTVSYLILTGREPAATHQELLERAQTGLSLTAVIDGVPDSLELLVQAATLGDVSARPASMADVLALLDDVDDEFERGTEEIADPATATTGDELGSGVTVVERLGAGATAYAMLVERDGVELVLKVARSSEHNDRLRDEGEVVKQLSHSCLVRLWDVVEVGDRVGLLLSNAGTPTLGALLRETGRPHLDMLERWGSDLLEAVGYLESMGIPHRDIKPDNLGVAERPGNRERHLVLFDFSLARAPADNIRAGTTGYLDPFLSSRGTWDLHADRWSTAVTLYQMATSDVPRFGDGRSEPAAIDSEAEIAEHSFDVSVAPQLTAFFRKAFRRSAVERFDTTEEMLRAWREAFEQVDVSTTGHDEEVEFDAAQVASRASLDDPIVALGVPGRASELLERIGASKVRDVLNVDVVELSRTSGVGNQTRRVARDLVRALRERFADQIAVNDESLSVDLLVQKLIPRGPDKKQERFCEAILGLAQATLVDDVTSSDGAWAPVSTVAEGLSLSPDEVASAVDVARGRWLRTPALTTVRRDIETALASEGGVLTVDELATALLARRGSARSSDERLLNAAAVVRAALEAETGRKDARFVLHRHSGRPIVASTVNEFDEPIDGIAVAAYAAALGERADALAEADPPLPPTRVVEELRSMSAPEGGITLPDSRLVRLAAAASASAAVSGRLELYPRGLPAGRALTLARGALLALGQALPDAIARRVASRFPDAEPLPGRPELDRLLQAAGVELVWDEEREAYMPAEPTLTGTSSRHVRRPTTLEGAPEYEDPEVLDAAQFERRLETSTRRGGFLCLVGHDRSLDDIRDELARRFDAQHVSLDRLLIHHLRLAAGRRNVVWQTVVDADAATRDSRAWGNLQQLFVEAVERAEGELLAYEGTVLATDPGLLARYGQLEMIDRLRDRAGSSGWSLSTLWLLVPDDNQSDRPAIDGQAIPIIGAGQWARVPSAWIENRHRGRAA
ncbi:MAG: BREX system serine/threonine kinase PglW [Gaiellaceae bacterium MAG52_C11]|nr:BREX system serine/threonine kinase PglW [Candidatus Gaiellasilicea maunaloa]